MEANKIIDITRKISSNIITWPGDRKCKIFKDLSIKNGDPCNVSSIEMNLHTGTHIDAPLHFINDGQNISSIDLSHFIGNAKVFELDVEHFIDIKHLENLPINMNDRILFKTRNSLLPDSGDFNEDYVYINIEAAKYLVKKQIRTVGIDYISIGGYDLENQDIHKLLLGNNIGIIEGLNLANASSGSFFLSCLPLNIDGADGAPARAVIIPNLNMP